jgi:hypothetical protein
MNALQSIFDRVRSLAREQCPRQLPRRSAKPPIGARIVQVESGVRLTVQAGLSDELWIWLLDRGWRVVTHRPDRRRYREISWSRVTRLIDCGPAHRERVLTEAIWDAESRPTVANRSTNWGEGSGACGAHPSWKSGQFQPFTDLAQCGHRRLVINRLAEIGPPQ